MTDYEMDFYNQLSEKEDKQIEEAIKKLEIMINKYQTEIKRLKSIKTSPNKQNLKSRLGKN
jgi:hypothetical protein